MPEHGMGGALPSSLRGYKLKKIHHGFGRLILWIIIILVIIWFIKRDILFSIWDYILGLVQ